MIALLYVGLATGSLVWAVSPTFPVAHCHHIRTLVLFAVHTPCSFDALIALGLKALLTSDGKILFYKFNAPAVLASSDTIYDHNTTINKIHSNSFLLDQIVESIVSPIVCMKMCPERLRTINQYATRSSVLCCSRLRCCSSLRRL